MLDQFKKAINKIKSGEQTIHLMPVYGFNFQLGRLNLLLGSPGAGKSLMTMHVMLKSMSENKKILLLSSEMSIYQYTIRILKHELGIRGDDATVIKQLNSPLCQEILEKLVNQLDDNVDYRNVFRENLEELLSDTELPNKYDLICLDYIQNTPWRSCPDEYSRLTALTGAIKSFTLSGLDKTGVICSQVGKAQFNSNGKVDDNTILMPKGSNAIFESSDFVVQLIRDPDTGLVQISNTKNKDCQVDPKKVYKINPDLRFSEVR